MKELHYRLSKSDLHILINSPIFTGISEEKLKFLLESKVSLRSFDKDEIIYSPKNFEESLGIVLKGSAVAEKSAGVILNHFKAGSCFGVATLFSPHKRYVTTVKASSSCCIAFFTEDSMKELFRAEERIALNYITFLSGRIHFLNSKIDTFTAVSAEDKLSLWLLEQYESSGSCIQLDRSYGELADSLAIGRSSLYRALDQLEAAGILKKEKKLLHILDPEKLVSQIH